VHQVNLVLTVTHNCLEQTKRMVASVEAQDIPTSMIFVDNGSSDGTQEWLADRMPGYFHQFNEGVSHAWNEGINLAFQLEFPSGRADHVLVANNDVQLAPWTYSLLLSYDLPFVTGVATDDPRQIEQARPPQLPVEDHPDFSLFLIRRDAWEKIGKFDERMKLYAQDCDYHLRGFRLGVPMKKACVPFFHESSATVKHAPPQEQTSIYQQANADRQVFQSLWGCQPGTPEYYALFAESCFGMAK
jgi:GT2 family glycosyltransferase